MGWLEYLYKNSVMKNMIDIRMNVIPNPQDGTYWYTLKWDIPV